jgi:hypothetical protein
MAKRKIIPIIQNEFAWQLQNDLPRQKSFFLEIKGKADVWI